MIFGLFVLFGELTDILGLKIVTLPKEEFDVVDNYHKKPGMHKTLDGYTLRDPGTVGGWTYEQMGWNLDKEGNVIS